MAHCLITNGLVPTISISLGTFEPGSGCNPVRYGCQTVRHQVCNRTVAYSNCLDTGMQLVATPLPSNLRHPTVPTSSLYNLHGPSTTGLDFHSSYTKKPSIGHPSPPAFERPERSPSIRVPRVLTDGQPATPATTRLQVPSTPSTTKDHQKTGYIKTRVTLSNFIGPIAFSVTHLFHFDMSHASGDAIIQSVSVSP